MKGKLCVVTGATSGIGRETALGLAQQGAEVVLVGRDRAKTEVVLDEIKNATGNNAIHYALADLSSQGEIRHLAEELKERYPRLDVLVNNAGALFMSRRESVDGIEMSLAVNYLSAFLLTNLLLDRLTASAPARIVNVASEGHRQAKPDLVDLQWSKRRYNGLPAYSRAKLALIMFSHELARRLEGSGVTVNTLHPGVVASNFGQNNGWAERKLWRIIGLFAQSPAKGAATSLYLATSPDVEGVTGKYFVKKKAQRSSPISYKPEMVKKLWEASEQLTHLSEPA
jgi:retinol dehydrogenase 12